ncbi:MAG: thioester domain-containing protein [Streptomyces sp.]|uniref:thioester domain-containing protein n=1 Tax=Streptomyces sp. TaxID=1931 RepID=UPI003D6C3784
MAEATLIGLVRGGWLVLTFAMLFSRFLFQARGAAWMRAFLDGWQEGTAKRAWGAVTLAYAAVVVVGALTLEGDLSTLEWILLGLLLAVLLADGLVNVLPAGFRTFKDSVQEAWVRRRGAGTAAAGDEPPRQGGATATLDGLKTYDQAVVHEDGESRRTGAGLSEMAVDDGGTLQTYCIDMDNPTQQQARYAETPWSATSLHDNPDAGKIRWILQHSYPQVNDLQALAKSSGAGRLSPATAAAGTQVAIWRYTENTGQAESAEKTGSAEHDKGTDGVGVTAADPAAEKLADHLQRAARKLAEPQASLSLDPAGVSGAGGGRLGPVTVRTTAPSVAVSPAPDAASRDVRVVGKDGKPVTAARDGARLYFDVPDKDEPASTSLTVQAATKIPVGRAFTGVGAGATSQTQILAGSSQSTVSATASVHWAKDGALPAVTAEKNCVKGGVDVTVANPGDRPFHFKIADKDHEVAGGRTKTVTVPVAEDQPYRISVTPVTPVTGQDGFAETFTGVLDCATASAVDGKDDSGISPQSRTAAAGGARTGAAGTGVVDDGGDLARTGASNTPLILGIAIGLVLLGLVAVLAVRKRTPDSGDR